MSEYENSIDCGGQQTSITLEFLLDSCVNYAEIGNNLSQDYTHTDDAIIMTVEVCWWHQPSFDFVHVTLPCHWRVCCSPNMLIFTSAKEDM